MAGVRGDPFGLSLSKPRALAAPRVAAGGAPGPFGLSLSKPRALAVSRGEGLCGRGLRRESKRSALRADSPAMLGLMAR
ncbi:MAG: hypothetical protein ACK57B_16670, partial [Betaproteobacteria bacterium]